MDTFPYPDKSEIRAENIRVSLASLFFPLAVVYQELLLRAFDKGSVFFSLELIPTVLFSLAAGLFIFFVLDLLPWKTVSKWIGGILLFLGTVILCIERGCRSMFGVYYGLTFMGAMAGDVATGFGSTVWSVIVSILPFILLSLVPLAVYIPLCRYIIRRKGRRVALRLILAGLVIVFHLAGFLFCFTGQMWNYYTYDFSANNAIPQFGLLTSLRLELEYAAFGTPQAPLPTIEPDVDTEKPESPSTDGDFDEPAVDDKDTPDSPLPEKEPGDDEEIVEYGYNALDIDFNTLASQLSGDAQALSQYLASLTPSQQNEYTGMFKGKNLILITAEAFSPYVISQELTPTLYKLSHQGFVFNNFYQPNWTQSTSGGEFAVMTGIIPNWFGSRTAFSASKDKYMPIALGWQFRELGYNVPAWHDNEYTYYSRDKTHPNLGYDYTGIGNGLTLASNLWPNSDLEMMEATVSSFIDDYIENGTPFHAYYMTVSGHCNYNWAGNAMSRKHREVAENAYPDASQEVQAYIACNLELEAAMTYLVDQLEEAGIADDTLIVLTADHYPYQMASGSVDYYNELRGFTDTERDTSRYLNTLIMWSASIDDPIVVDTPCSSIDIVPTICNLFGLKYDSRLYSGRDILATNYEVEKASTCMPLVVFSNTGSGSSWITAAGTYEASTGTFTSRDGITVEDGYVEAVSNLVKAKCTYAKQLIQQDYYQLLADNGYDLLSQSAVT